MATPHRTRRKQATTKGFWDPGRWILFWASVAGMFALAPVLEGRLGDFWSFAAFLPIWTVLYLLIHIIEFRTEGSDERE